MTAAREPLRRAVELVQRGELARAGRELVRTAVTDEGVTTDAGPFAVALGRFTTGLPSCTWLDLIEQFGIEGTVLTSQRDMLDGVVRPGAHACLQLLRLMAATCRHQGASTDRVRRAVRRALAEPPVVADPRGDLAAVALAGLGLASRLAGSGPNPTDLTVTLDRAGTSVIAPVLALCAWSWQRATTLDIRDDPLGGGL